MPYTDLTVYADGTVGLCCSDALEKTNFGNLKEKSIVEIFNGCELTTVRKKMQYGRDHYDFCRHCDFIDAGIRYHRMKYFNKKGM